MRGFGLVEIMLALVLGLMLSLALTHIFISSKSTWMSQASSASLQEDARFVLGKMLQEVRLAGTFGCLGNIQDASLGGRFAGAVKAPVQWEQAQQSLTLISAAVGAKPSWYEWVVHTDCVSSATAWSRGRAPQLKVGEFALPIQRHVYRFNQPRNELTLDGQPLISHVREFRVLFGVAATSYDSGVIRYTTQADPGLIRSVHMTLTLFDPADRTQEHTFSVVAALRSRAG